MGYFFRLVDMTNELVGKLMSIIVVATVLIITFGVIMRYIFKSPIPVVFELTIYPLAAVYALSTGYALLHNAHVNVDAIIHRLSPRHRLILAFATFPVFLVFCAALIWSGFPWAWHSFLINETSGSSWSLKLYPYKFALPIGAVLLLLQGTVNLIRQMDLTKKASK
ncbi:MAG: TRAP transporter small permease subunit [Syntrophomonadaceae bacterium]|nr:TRAP transporter small permease subunit [Syntrophomonadaceae bacterium]